MFGRPKAKGGDLRLAIRPLPLGAAAAAAQRGPSVPPGAREGRQAHQGDCALRHIGFRPGTDHRAGNHARGPPRRRQRPDQEGMGRTLEKNVLVGAARAHLEERVDVNKCIVFEE
ncbi:hypothetical protein THAOC_19332 [Thalassiosira oceanica]|uniref:Uncharacterized protein n=1 Tax=Thalassiosira oceanica TaxID=159749 RepID=K0S2M2_THAOC|nr:hypothetical protein THAOC_19332 [Thalassiosira oceanica]|eukprot:EJK60333.1 hypothetical protein THAOC_19332 [Thalassiosira oceanica]